MFSGRVKFITLFILGFFIISVSFAQESEKEKNNETLKKGPPSFEDAMFVHADSTKIELNINK